MKKGLGEKHLGFAIGQLTLAAQYAYLGDNARAIRIVEPTLEMFKNKLGEEHPLYGTSLSTLGRLYVAVGDYQCAVPLYLQASKAAGKLGETHPQYAAVLSSTAWLYHRLGGYDQAMLRYQHLADIYRKAYGEDHPRYAQSLNGLALAHHGLGDYAKAEQAYRQALAINEKSLGKSHYLYATNLVDLATTCAATGRHDEALAVFTEALSIQQENLLKGFAFSSESSMRTFVKTMAGTLPKVLTLVLRQSEHESSANATALTWVLRRKAIVFETMCRFRDAQHLMAEDPKVAQDVLKLQSLKQQLANLALRPHQAGRAERFDEMRNAVQSEAEHLEAHLNRSLDAAGSRDVTRDVGIDTVRERIPTGAALVEIVSFSPYEFHAKGKEARFDSRRYVAFVLLPEPQSPVRIIDLGDAATIDALVNELGQHIQTAQDWYRRSLAGREADLEKGFKQAASGSMPGSFAVGRGPGRHAAYLPCSGRSSPPRAFRNAREWRRQLLDRRWISICLSGQWPRSVAARSNQRVRAPTCSPGLITTWATTGDFRLPQCLERTRCLTRQRRNWPRLIRFLVLSVRPTSEGPALGTRCPRAPRRRGSRRTTAGQPVCASPQSQRRQRVGRGAQENLPA